MYHHIFESSESYPVALLLRQSAFAKQALIQNYITPLAERGIPANNIIAFTLAYEGKTLGAQFGRDYLDTLLPELHGLGVQYILCTDAGYFKLLTGVKNTETQLGYVLPCKVKGFEHMQVVLSLNYQQLIYKPELQTKLDQSLHALCSHVSGCYQAPGTGIIKQAIYPDGLEAIRQALEQLLDYPALSCDIEAFDLKHYNAGIGTIAFAPDTERFVAFPCDYKPNMVTPPLAEKRQEFGRFVPNPEVRKLLREFFTRYQGNLTFHNAAYDVKVIVYTLWMESMLDQRGLLTGLEIMTRNWDDTKIVAYLATNTTAGNVLGLKPLAHEFAGNWAVDDIKDIRLIPLPQLLQYNGVDCLSTNYVKAKYWPIMVADQQLDLYNSLMMPSQRLIIQMELTGMPMNKAKIEEVEAKLMNIWSSFDAQIRQQAIIPLFEEYLTRTKWQKDYEDRRDKAKNPDKIFPKDWEQYKKDKWAKFNPNSDTQLQVLLYDERFLGMPVIDKTDTKQPATGEKTLKKLLNHPIGEANKDLLEGLIGVSQVSTILSNFIPAFKRAIAKADDGIVWLHGSFNLGGTVSGRLSSSDPNMQNIPAKSIFAKVIKECFMAPQGWLFAGADFNSLEDYISALTTKDPNKLKVYTDGFDGHALRAAYYFKEDLEKEGIFIDMTDPKSVNWLKKTDHWSRQKSKTPTFALTYQGTWITLMQNLGWPEVMAKNVEASYHQMYEVSDRWIQAKLEQATKDGYVTVAFGLRLRTPLLGQVVWNGHKMPYEAAAEGRTAGNALGQSYGLLNNRAAVDFWRKVWASPYRYDILPSALIHDAIYMVLRDDPAIVEWANRELIKSMQWQELPEIQHDTVKLGAALDLFWPHWGNAITLPNNASQQEIIDICKQAANDYKEKQTA